MTQHLSQKAIDEYREVFYLFATRGSGTLEDAGHLRYVLRNTGFSPTTQEAQAYFKDKKGRVDFAAFLDVVHVHSGKEAAGKEILGAFAAHDRKGDGRIPASELRAVLTGIGERLSAVEVDRIFKEANIQPNSLVRYEDFVNMVLTPLPDYL